MGIYFNDTIFGIRIYNNNNDYPNIIFEKKYNQVMNVEQMKEVYVFYNKLNNKNELKFQYYTECTTTYGDDSYFDWFPITLNVFLEKFNIK
jgi:hypothetical protein